MHFLTNKLENKLDAKVFSVTSIICSSTQFAVFLFICRGIFLNSHVKKNSISFTFRDAFQGPTEKFDQKTARTVMKVRS